MYYGKARVGQWRFGDREYVLAGSDDVLGVEAEGEYDIPAELEGHRETGVEALAAAGESVQ